VKHRFSFPRLVVLDLDGTLIDSRLEIANAVNHVRKKCDLAELSVSEIEPLIGLPPSHFFPEIGPEAAVDSAVRKFRNFLSENLGTFSKPMAGSLDLLEFLKVNQIGCAIATTKPTSLARAAIAACGISVDFTQGTDDFDPKPNPEVIVRCMREFSRKGVETLMVGDRAQDVLAGRAAGCTTVGITSDTISKKDFRKTPPDYLFESLKGLHRWIEEELS
jgi:phosphoglycolate phosphatase